MYTLPALNSWGLSYSTKDWNFYDTKNQHRTRRTSDRWRLGETNRTKNRNREKNAPTLPARRGTSYVGIRRYLFWVGFGALGGFCLKLGSTAFLGYSFMAPLILFGFVDTEAVETSSFLDWIISLSLGIITWHWQNEEHTRISTMIKAKRAAKVLALIFMMRLAEEKIETRWIESGRNYRRGSKLDIWSVWSHAYSTWSANPLAWNMPTRS